jgi:hypothetical protein
MHYSQQSTPELPPVSTVCGMLGCVQVIGAERGAERAMGYRGTPEGQRQASVLRAAEHAAGRARSLIVAGLPMEHDQYKRYVRGDTPLKWDQIPLFAAAYGVPTQDLTRALGLVAPDDPDWDFLAELKRLWPNHPEAVEATYRGLAHAPQDVQRIVIAEIAQTLRRDRSESQAPDHPDRAERGLVGVRRTG